MELYNKQFVYFDWDDSLKGKKGFFADNIEDLKRDVKNNIDSWFGEIHKNTKNATYPFESMDDSGVEYPFRFCYYDPYYEFRKAYIEGKQLQFKTPEGWGDVDGIPLFTTDEYRIKPELKWHVVLGGLQVLGITKDPQGKHVYFKGTEDECNEWIDEHKNFVGTMVAWEEGKTIQYLHDDEWRDVSNYIPLWDLNDTYRVKPDDCKGCMKYDYCANKDGIRCKSYCTKATGAAHYVPFDTVQELIDAWDSKYPQNKNRPEGTMPLIWIKNKVKNRVYLITDFLFDKYFNDDIGTEDSNFQLKELFENYTFLDNSIIGKVKED